MHLIERLQSFGLTEKEAETYLALAELGRSSAHALAKRSGVPRTTAYSLLDSLVRKGFASVDRARTVNAYLANDPSVLLRKIEREREALRLREHEAEELIELVRPSFRSRFYHAPKIQFYEGRDGVEQMLYHNLERWQESIKEYDRVWWGYQDHTFVETFLPWLRHYWSRKEPEERVQLISNAAWIEEELRGKIEGREIRSIPVLLEFSSTIWVLGDYIVLVMTRQEPLYSFQLHDPVFAANLRSLFQLLWNLEQSAS